MKLQGGEYTALTRLELTYKSCHLVSNICVHAILDAAQTSAPTRRIAAGRGPAYVARGLVCERESRGVGVEGM